MYQKTGQTPRRASCAGLVLVLMVLTGCATVPATDPRDPLESFNRGVYRFNDAVDGAVIKPVATAYQEVLPKPVQRGVRNFFANLQDLWSGVNNALQFKGEQSANSFVRFGVNTFIGLGGVLDVASEMKIERHTKDFGHTLGYWGVAPGPYLVLPLLGSSTLRDTLALPVDAQGNLVNGIEHVPTRNSLTALRLIDTRASYLGASAMLEEAALDKYTFTRDSYLQRRRSGIYDGNPPDDGESQKSPVKQDFSDARERTRAWVKTIKESGSAGQEKAKP